MKVNRRLVAASSPMWFCFYILCFRCLFRPAIGCVYCNPPMRELGSEFKPWIGKKTKETPRMLQSEIPYGLRELSISSHQSSSPPFCWCLQTYFLLLHEKVNEQRFQRIGYQKSWRRNSLGHLQFGFCAKVLEISLNCILIFNYDNSRTTKLRFKPVEIRQFIIFSVFFPS